MINLKFNNEHFKSAFQSASQSNVSLIFSLPGSGTAAFINALNLFSYQENKENIFVVDIFNTQQGTTLEISNTSYNNHNCISFHKDTRYTLNPLDLTFGFDKPNNEDDIFLSSFLSSIFYYNSESYSSLFEKDFHTESLIKEMISLLYKNKKYYTRGENRQVDFYLDKAGIKNTTLSWFTIRNIFVSQGAMELAVMAHYQAMPVLHDISVLLYSEKIQRSFMKLVDIDRINTSLEYYQKNFPFFFKNTNIPGFFDTTFGHISMDKHISSNQFICSAQIVMAHYFYKKLSWKSIAKENKSFIKAPEIIGLLGEVNLLENSTTILINEFQRMQGISFCDSWYNHIISQIVKNKNIKVVFCTLSLNDMPVNILQYTEKFYLLDYSKRVEREFNTQGIYFDKNIICDFFENKGKFIKEKNSDNHYDHTMNFMIIERNLSESYNYNQGSVTFNSLDYWSIALSKEDAHIVKKLNVLFHQHKIKEILSQDYPDGKIKKQTTPMKIGHSIINRYL